MTFTPIVTTDNEEEAARFLRSGFDHFFIDLENGRSPEGNIIPAPHTPRDCARFRKIGPNIKIVLRPDGERIQNPDYLKTVLDLGVDRILFPNAEDIDVVEGISASFSAQGAVFTGMIESEAGLENLPSLLEIEHLHGVYVGLHDFSKAMGYRHVFEPILNGHLKKMADHASRAQKAFGFTSVSPALSDNMVLALMKEHARLGSTMTLAPTSRLANAQIPDAITMLKKLTGIYELALIKTPVETQEAHEDLITLLNNAKTV
jgi:2-keto-3-deoxy-L-rhamnonate aldolase RhmA